MMIELNEMTNLKALAVPRSSLLVSLPESGMKKGIGTEREQPPPALNNISSGSEKKPYSGRAPKTRFDRPFSIAFYHKKQFRCGGWLFALPYFYNLHGFSTLLTTLFFLSIQVYFDGDDVMPLWTPPTPPQDETDVHVDHCMAFMYEQSLMAESELPPVYIPKHAKRLKLDSTSTLRSKQRVKRDEVTIPRSLFDRPPMAVLKLRRELKSLRMRGHLVGGPDVVQLQKILNQLGPNLTITPPMTLLTQAQNSKSPQLLLAGLQQENQPEWTIGEEYATLQAIQQIQELPINLVVVSPAHTPNWDLVSDFVSSNSPSFRSTRICRHHYESVVVPREEGKGLNVQESLAKRNKKQKLAGEAGESIPVISPSPPKARQIRTMVLHRQDDNSSFSKNSNSRFETVFSIASRRTATARPVFVSGIGKCNPKHITLLQENGINNDVPLTPMDIALNRQERLAREKAKTQQLQADNLARQKQQQIQQKLAAQQQHLKAQQMAIQQSPIRVQGYGPAPTPVLGPRAIPTPPTPQPTRNQEVEQLAQQLSQAAANFTAASQAQQAAQMAANLPRSAMVPDQSVVGGIVNFQQQATTIQSGIPSKPMGPQQVQALNRGQAVVRTRQINHPSQMQGQTVQLHQLPAPTRFQIATGGQPINLPPSSSLPCVQTSTVVSSSLQVTAGQRVLTATKTGQPFIARQATEADLQQLLRPRAQVPGQARLPHLGQILQIHPVQTSATQSMTQSLTTTPLVRNITPQSTLTSTPQTVTIPISVSGMNILSSHPQKLAQGPPNYQMKQIPLSMLPGARRLPATTQVAMTGQQMNPIPVSVSQVPMQQQQLVSQQMIASTNQAKTMPQQKGAQYGTIQILQSSSPGQKLQIQQLQQIIKSGGLVLNSSNIVSLTFSNPKT